MMSHGIFKMRVTYMFDLVGLLDCFGGWLASFHSLRSGQKSATRVAGLSFIPRFDLGNAAFISSRVASSGSPHDFPDFQDQPLLQIQWLAFPVFHMTSSTLIHRFFQLAHFCI